MFVGIDGDSHVPKDPASHDVARTRRLEEQGYRVIRFSAQRVEGDLARVVGGIRTACEEGSTEEG